MRLLFALLIACLIGQSDDRQGPRQRLTPAQIAANRWERAKAARGGKVTVRRKLTIKQLRGLRLQRAAAARAKRRPGATLEEAARILMERAASQAAEPSRDRRATVRFQNLELLETQ